jgi:predicted  nucleic acid-binding Zn-ribbon protein
VRAEAAVHSLGTVNAAPDDQLRLLDLQELDSTADRLGLRRRTLPEIEAAEELDGRVRRLADDIVLLETEDSDLGREQAKVDADVEQVRTRMTRDQQRLDAGQVGSPKELENLQHEIESLKRRQSDLEDAELEVMEKREIVQRRTREIADDRVQAERELEETIKRRDDLLAEIDAEVEKTNAQRVELAGTLPADLLALYEKVRASSAGVGAAALRRGRCEGCHLQLNTTDLNRISAAPIEEVLRCEECRRILVRTADSGL